MSSSYASIAALTCRACLKKTLENYFEFNRPCYFTSNDLTLCDAFNACTKLKANPNDGLPQSLCEECLKELEYVYNFQQKVFKSDESLRNLIGRSNSETGICDDIIKDPLENVTDEEDLNNNFDDLPKCFNDSNKRDIHYCDNKEHKLNTVTSAVTSSDSDDMDNDFLESVELQIFPQGRFICPVCGKSYFTNTGLEAHKEIHLPKRKRQNTHRDKVKSKQDIESEKHTNLQNIDESENEDKSNNSNNNEISNGQNNITLKPKKCFPCNVCGKQLISVSKLRYHMVMHTGEKDFLCTMCPKAYSTIYALKHHMRAHTGERPYECKFCGDRFLRPTTLKSHMRRHTGERPYGCDICGKRFIQHSSMATHIKLNHMDKTIFCPYCDKKYARQTDLNTHLLSHSGDKPYGCKMCPSRFTRQSNLNKHMNQQHPSSYTGNEVI